MGILIFLFLVFSTKTCFADEIKPPAGKPFSLFMEQHKDVLDLKIRLVSLGHELARVKERERRDFILYSMEANLHSQKSASEEEYQKALLEYETSRLGVKELEKKIEEVRFDKIYHETRLEWREGKKETSTEAIKNFKSWWGARLETAKVQVELAETKYRIHRLLFEITERLKQANAVSLSDYIKSKATDRDAQEALVQARDNVTEFEKAIKTINEIVVP